MLKYGIIIYVSFYLMIAFAVYYTNNANCLWALLIRPSIKTRKNNEHR